MTRIRTFIAIEAPDELKKVSQRLIRTLAKTKDWPFRWVGADQFHLTVKFLGDVDERDVHQVCQRTREVAARHAPFQIPCCGLGGFPSDEKTRTIWMGVDDSESRLGSLHQDLDLALQALGVAREGGRFRGHLTLGRLPAQQRGAGVRLPELVPDGADQSYGWLPVDQLIVFASQLHRDGPVHSVMGRCPLGEGPIVVGEEPLSADFC